MATTPGPPVRRPRGGRAKFGDAELHSVDVCMVACEEELGKHFDGGAEGSAFEQAALGDQKVARVIEFKCHASKGLRN